MPDRASWSPFLPCDYPNRGITIGDQDTDSEGEVAEGEVAEGDMDSSSEEEDDAEGEHNKEKDEGKGVKLCVVCDAPCKQRCSQCKVPYYCSVEHQRQDWKNGHKAVCQDLALSQKELDKTLSMGDAKIFGKLASAKDKQFERFKAAIRSAPSQVIRYDRWSPNVCFSSFFCRRSLQAAHGKGKINAQRQ